MKNLVAAFVIVLLAYSARAQGVWCSTVIENLETGHRNVGFSRASAPSRELSEQDLSSITGLGAVTSFQTQDRIKITTALLGLIRNTIGDVPNFFQVWINRVSNPVGGNASLKELDKKVTLGVLGLNGSNSTFDFWSGRVTYKQDQEQYLSPELSYSYNTGKEFIEHQCRVCSPKMGTCPDFDDPKAFEKEALKLNATLVEAKLF